MTHDRFITGLCTWQFRTLDSYWYYDLSFKDVGSDRDRAVTVLKEPEKIEAYLAELTKDKPWVGRVVVERAR